MFGIAKVTAMPHIDLVNIICAEVVPSLFDLIGIS